MNLDEVRPGLTIESRSCQEWAAAYLSGERPDEPATPEKHGVINEEASFCAIAAAFHKDMSYVERLLTITRDMVSSEKPNFEYVYGHAGILYLMRLVRHWYPESAAKINHAMTIIIENILANGPPWTFYIGGRESTYDFVGLGHGRMGIMVQILLCDSTRAPKLKPALIELLDIQAENGNWPARWPDPNGNYKEKGLVQWCHGAPGMVQALATIRQFYPHLESRIDEAIEKGMRLTWEKGLLIKEPNLCHGITGNAFTFPPGQKRDHFLAYTTEQKVREGYESGIFVSCDYGRKCSVGFGGIGRAVGWMWRDKEKGCYLGFDDV